MLVVSTLFHVWRLTLFIAGLFAILSLLSWKLKLWKRDIECPASPVFYMMIVSWFLFMSLLLTLIDEPRLDILQGVESLTFMVSAFLGIPLSVPLLALAVYAQACMQHAQKLKIGVALLLAFGTFALGLAASNIHDIIWCGAITNGFSVKYAAGGDLDAFAWLGVKLGIASETMYDYLTLGASAFVMVLGEIAWAIACFARLRRSARAASDSAS